jgi:superoxide dismutase, Cu-Zn family
MRISSLLLSALLLAAFGARADERSVTIYAINPDGIGDAIGTIKLSDSSEGVVLTPALARLAPGPHGFHIHEKPSCGPHGGGHMGDMPVIEADASGNATKRILVPHITLADISNRAVMIHEGGDNYSDSPKPLGGGGARVACGVIR